MSNIPQDMQNTIQTGVATGNASTQITSGQKGSSSGVHNNPTPKNTPPSSSAGDNQPKPKRDAHGRYVCLALAIAGLVATIAGMNGHELICQYARWFGCASLIYYAARKGSLATWILISMVIGTEVGYSFSSVGVSLRLFSNIFLRLIKSIIAPLLFGTLVVGIAGHANIREVGRMGIKALIYFEIITTLALFVGLAAINLTHAGDGIVRTNNATAEDALGTHNSHTISSEGLLQAAEGIEKVAQKHVDKQHLMHAAEGLRDLAGEIDEANKAKLKSPSGMDTILHVFPENIAKSVVENQVLQVVVFSVMFGIALAQVPEDKRKPMLAVCESLTDVMFKYTNMVMLIAPLGVGSAIAYTVGSMGFGVLGNLAKLVGTLYVSLLAFIIIVLVPVMLICRINVLKFLKAVSEPMTLAFATTSSEAALPKAMEKMEAFGVPRHIVAFVMPTGYSFNLDGTTLYLSLATVFVAQAANIDLSFGTQLLIVLTLMLTSKGVAGMPRASLVILLGAAASFNLPEWPILAILGVDELMDMARTATNVLGNCLASVVVAKWEGQLGPSREQQDTIAVARLMWDSNTNSVKSLDSK